MRYKCTVSYDGTNFHGFQTQKKGLRTVQEELETVLLTINKVKTNVYASGRTDTGVHAYGQVFHFDSDINMAEENMRNAINTRLPKDAYVTKVEKVSREFHARFSAVSKEYHYLIDFGEYDPFQKNYRFFCHYRHDLSLFKAAMMQFLGVHDFRSFTKNKSLSDTVREIQSIEFEEKGTLLTIKIRGSGFMHNMVRILVAMALEVGRNKITLEQLKFIMDQKNRVFSPKILPSSGLYLVSVFYPDDPKFDPNQSESIIKTE